MMRRELCFPSSVFFYMKIDISFPIILISFEGNVYILT